MRKYLFFLSLCFFFALSTNAQKKKFYIETEYGKITLALYDKTPLHRDNMVRLIKKHFYDGTLFHRIIPEFMIQGGDPESKTAKPGQRLGNGDVGYKVSAEINNEYFHKRGALAMARDENPQKASSGCQFYIVVGKKYTDNGLIAIEQRSHRTISPEQKEVYKTIGGTPFLDGNYTVFGEVLSGMDAVDKIVNQTRDGNDRPLKNMKMIKVRMKKKFLFF